MWDWSKANRKLADMVDELAKSSEVPYLVNHIRYNGQTLQQVEELNHGNTVSEAVSKCTSESKALMKVQCADEIVVVIKSKPVKASNRLEDKT
mgnify:CR=1 FL=1